ncbi:MAG TPA: NAD(P)-dependent oxidoreductase [Tepidisphaeraceae bacterium]|jgi:precorrin-2 dehydrogenase/sirohydrochlorin ferrochelatase
MPYPILLDVTHLRIVIVGGGGVARRKAGGLIDAGATDITVVSPTLADDFPPVRHVASVYTPRTLADARLVFAATNDPAVNTNVINDARAVGALVCRADTDDDHPGDFVTPAKFSQGPITVTVSAGSAALSAAIRDGLRQRFDPRWAKMAEAMSVLRPMLRDASGLSPARRASAFRRLASEEALDVLDRQGTAGLLAWLQAFDV